MRVAFCDIFQIYRHYSHHGSIFNRNYRQAYPFPLFPRRKPSREILLHYYLALRGPGFRPQMTPKVCERNTKLLLVRTSADRAIRKGWSEANLGSHTHAHAYAHILIFDDCTQLQWRSYKGPRSVFARIAQWGRVVYWVLFPTETSKCNTVAEGERSERIRVHVIRSTWRVHEHWGGRIFDLDRC
jgi:hypothetical protein